MATEPRRRAAAVVGIIHGDIAVLLNSDDWADPDWVDRQPGPTKTSGDRCGGAPLSAFERERAGWFPVELDWVFGCAGVGHQRRRRHSSVDGPGCSAPMPLSFSALN